jgi:hypothetical protein
MKSDDEFCSSCGKKRFQYRDLSIEMNITKHNEEENDFLLKKEKEQDVKTLWYKFFELRLKTKK